MDNTVVRIQSTIDAKVFSDFSTFNFFVLHHRWTWFVLFPILLGGFAYANLITGSTILCILFIVIGCLVPLGSLLSFKISLKNQIKANSLDKVSLGYTVILGNEGIEVITEKEKQNLAWKQVYRLYLNKEYLYLYVSKTKAFILPFRGIEQGSKEELIHLVSGSLPLGRFIKARF
ncbi:YcxB family protein [uncultured Sphaerochaeta sp.]|uniref:YcxB family protein n=1 Tax=uncultured Sphaerochaeta sp. TaxID=886478 RepID=UPI002A0A6ADF|nr:YcxB family protein [uncultured Sphaerochaeta sp.]